MACVSSNCDSERGASCACCCTGHRKREPQKEFWTFQLGTDTFLQPKLSPTTAPLPASFHLSVQRCGVLQVKVQVSGAALPDDLVPAKSKAAWVNKKVCGLVRRQDEVQVQRLRHQAWFESSTGSKYAAHAPVAVLGARAAERLPHSGVAGGGEGTVVRPTPVRRQGGEACEATRMAWM